MFYTQLHIILNAVNFFYFTDIRFIAFDGILFNKELSFYERVPLHVLYCGRKRPHDASHGL